MQNHGIRFMVPLREGRPNSKDGYVYPWFQNTTVFPAQELSREPPLIEDISYQHVLNIVISTVGLYEALRASKMTFLLQSGRLTLKTEGLMVIQHCLTIARLEMSPRPK